SSAAVRRVAELERELSETRDYLQSIQEQYEASTEELQASSEEVQSANEELQSINEELETSKEELESTNEELTTVNEEMTNRNVELNGLNSDLNNLHVSMDTAILVLGRDLTLRRFTVKAEKIFNLLATDVGRPLSGIRHNLDCRDLERFVREVIDTVSVRQREVQDKEGRWYSLRARPYQTTDNKIDGAVLVLVDIDALKRSEEEIKKAQVFADAILQEVPPLLILEKDLRVVLANESFYEHFKVTPAETERRMVFDLGDGQWQIPKLRTLLEEVLPRHRFFDDYEITHEFPGLGLRTMLLHGRQLDSVQRIVLRFEDITERLEAEAAVKRSEIRYRRLFEAAKDGILILDPVSRRITDANPFMTEFLGYSRAEFVGKELWQIGLLRDEEANKEAMRELQERGVIRYEDLPLKTKAGEKREVEFVSNLYDAGGQPVIQCNIRDITERKGAERALRMSETRLSMVLEQLPVAAALIDTTGRVVLRNKNMHPFMGDVVPSSDPQRLNLWRRSAPNSAPLRIEDSPGFRALQGEAVQDLELNFTQADGSEMWTSVTATPLRETDGAVTGAVVMIQDVTGRKDAEDALRKSERRLEGEVAALARLHELSGSLWRKSDISGGLQDMLDAAIGLLGADMGNVQILDPQKKVLEIAAQRGFQKDFLEFFREVSPDHDSACGRTLRAGRRTIIEDVETDDGYASYREIAAAAGYRAVQSTPLVGRDGTVHGILSTHFRAPHVSSEPEFRRLDLYIRQAVDFIERINGEQVLKESEERLRLALTSAGMGSWRGNLRTGLGTRDANLNRLLGLPAAESTQAIDDRFKRVHPEDRTAALTALQRATEEKESYEAEYRVILADGTLRWLSEKGRFIAGETGSPDFISGVLVDITERKTAEAALHGA
ncbi:MAG: PAS domain S-box protein, partial [Opitutaceae bacterium]